VAMTTDTSGERYVPPCTVNRSENNSGKRNESAILILELKGGAWVIIS